MARVFITGSADGLGLLAGKLLEKQGHQVVFHARSDARAKEALAGKDVVIGDVSTLKAMRSVAEQANRLGPFDAVIHNVAVMDEGGRGDTEDGISKLFAINVLAPYVLTALIARPKRLVYMSSGMHRGGTATLPTPFRGSYSDTKLLDVVFAFAVARLWPETLSNAVNPGWVPTKMGGRGAPDDLTLGATTQAWLAVSDDEAARATGSYFFHQKAETAHPRATDVAFQDEFLAYCAKISGIALE